MLGFVFAPIRTALHFGVLSGADVVVPRVTGALALLAFELLKRLGRRDPYRSQLRTDRAHRTSSPLLALAVGLLVLRAAVA